MKKIVKISDKEYTLQASAYTLFSYKDKTGRNLIDDINSLSSNKDQFQNGDMSNLGNLIDILLNITYVLYKEGETSPVPFDDFCKRLDGLFDNVEWIEDVIELSLSPLSRQLQRNNNSNN